MNYYVILDTNTSNWGRAPPSLFRDLVIFLNIYIKTKTNYQITVVANHKRMFDSDIDEIDDFYAAIKQLIGDLDMGSAVSPESSIVNDLGYVLCLKPYQVLLISLSPEKKGDFLRLIKCMSAAEKNHVRIDAFSLYDNQALSQCCIATGGKYHRKGSTLAFFIGLFGSGCVESLPSFFVNCHCHGKQVLLGLVCPICLCVYCKFVPVCRRCKSKFTFF